jgi:hypothetical protein
MQAWVDKNGEANTGIFAKFVANTPERILWSLH